MLSIILIKSHSTHFTSLQRRSYYCEKMYWIFSANLHESISKNKIVKNLVPSIRNTSKTPMAAVHCGWPPQSIDGRMSIFTKQRESCYIKQCDGFCNLAQYTLEHRNSWWQTSVICWAKHWLLLLDTALCTWFIPLAPTTVEIWKCGQNSCWGNCQFTHSKHNLFLKLKS